MATAINSSEVQAQADVAALNAQASLTTASGATSAQPNGGAPVNAAEQAATSAAQDQALLSQ